MLIYFTRHVYISAMKFATVCFASCRLWKFSSALGKFKTKPSLLLYYKGRMELFFFYTFARVGLLWFNSDSSSSSSAFLEIGLLFFRNFHWKTMGFCSRQARFETKTIMQCAGGINMRGYSLFTEHRSSSVDDPPLLIEIPIGAVRMRESSYDSRSQWTDSSLILQKAWNNAPWNFAVGCTVTWNIMQDEGAFAQKFVDNQLFSWEVWRLTRCLRLM